MSRIVIVMLIYHHHKSIDLIHFTVVVQRWLILKIKCNMYSSGLLCSLCHAGQEIYGRLPYTVPLYKKLIRKMYEN
jgi:hypothetical protein